VLAFSAGGDGGKHIATYRSDAFRITCLTVPGPVALLLWLLMVVAISELELSFGQLTSMG
jgi:hypothetical protein